MTLIKSKYELDKKCEKARDDIKAWRVFSLKDVCESIYLNKNESKKAWTK